MLYVYFFIFRHLSDATSVPFFLPYENVCQLLRNHGGRLGRGRDFSKEAIYRPTDVTWKMNPFLNMASKVPSLLQGK